MSEQDNLYDDPTDHEDLNTTPPNPAIGQPPPGNPVSGGWVMPKPVFRQSSGQPAVRENKYEYGSEDVTAVPSRPESFEDQPETAVTFPTMETVGEQPEMAEILPYEPEPAIQATPEEPRKGSSGLVMFAVSAILVIGFITLLLTVVYYLFLRPSSSNGIF